ncbi:winged helix-turn-helix domain-containing protein [Bradyrhizobium sp. U531]|uniref:winged helix-turn-helix domain-containing protein n=1 Tax=Bradyrhizobium sp. U531 TaxID=3053458 RepID=UPI003F42C203
MAEASPSSRRGDDPPSQQPVGFDGFVLEPRKGRLIGRDGDEIPLRPKALELLIALASSEGRPLDKVELLDRIWGDVHVTEDSLFQAVKDARRALDDRNGRLLRYMPRRGYMLDCELSNVAPQVPASEPAPRADRASIAVLPFRTLGERTPGYVAAGLVEEISIALSRFRWLFVLAHASAAAIAAGGEMADSLLTARKFGIRYVVDGSLEQTDDGIVVRCRLVETATGRQVWQERFTSEAAGILRLYEVITSSIAAAIEPRLLRAEVERVLRRGTANLDAFDCYLRALPGYYSRTPRGNGEAIGLLQAAIERDPHFALATALLGRCVATSVWLGTEADYAKGAALALTLARAALNMDRADPQVLALSGHLLAVVGGEHAEGGALLDLALQMNPNSAESWRLGGWVSAWSGDTDRALQRLAEAERLDPLSPLQSDVHSARSVALLVGRRFQEAVDAARRSIATTPEATAPRRFMIAALWHAGEHEEARRECAALMERQTNSSLARSRTLQSLRNPWMLDLLIDGLRGSGMPE